MVVVGACMVVLGGSLVTDGDSPTVVLGVVVGGAVDAGNVIGGSLVVADDDTVDAAELAAVGAV